MSEPIFPAPAHAAPTLTDPVEEAPESGGNRKALLAIGAVGAVLVAGAAAFFLLSGGSDPADEVPFVAAPQPAASAPAAAPSAAPSVVVKPAKANVSSRDPFKPLFPTAAPEPAPSAAPTAPAAGGGTTGTGSGTGTTGGDTSTGGDVGTPVTLAVAKVDPLAQTATVTVDGKKYPTSVNKVFGKYFVMYSVFNTDCVGILYGDQSVPVCVGKPQTVTF